MRSCFTHVRLTPWSPRIPMHNHRSAAHTRASAYLSNELSPTPLEVLASGRRFFSECFRWQQTWSCSNIHSLHMDGVVVQSLQRPPFSAASRLAGTRLTREAALVDNKFDDPADVAIRLEAGEQKPPVAPHPARIAVQSWPPTGRSWPRGSGRSTTSVSRLAASQSTVCQPQIAAQPCN